MDFYRFFDPPRPIKWLAVVVSAAAVWFSLVNLSPKHPFAMVSYVFATCTLVMMILTVIHDIHYFLNEYEPKTLVGRVVKDEEKRGLALMVWSTIYNLIFALLYLVPGIRDNLLWDGSVGGYYLILSVIRAYILYHTARRDMSREQEKQIFRVCAVMLLILDLMLGLLAYQITRKHIAAPKSQVFIIAVAAWTYFKLVLCIVQVIQNRKALSYLVSSDTAVNYAAVLVSILNLQSSMLAVFGDSEQFAEKMNFITGSAVFILIFIEGAVMLYMTRPKKSSPAK